MRSESVEMLKELVMMRIVILVEGGLKGKLVQLSKRLNNQVESRIVLGKRALPHITLYNASFPKGTIKKIKSSLEEISRKQYIFSISTTKKVSVRDDGYLGLSIKKTKEMYELHKELLRFLSPLRDKNIKIDPAIPKHRRELIKRYGTSNAGEAYHPHITIGLVDPIELSKGKKMLSKTPKLKYYVKEIALCQSEPLHTCRRVVARFKLSNK